MGVRAGGSFYGEVLCEGAGNGSGVSMYGDIQWIMSTGRIDPFPLNRMTDMTEIVTFLQLRWRVVKLLHNPFLNQMVIATAIA